MLAAQAVEVYRQEAFGYLLISNKEFKEIDAAICYQTAKRTGYYNVEDSVRSMRVREWVEKHKEIMDWHSHTYRNNQKLSAKPTKTDLKSMEKGDTELIIAVKKLKRNVNRPWDKVGKGVTGSVNGYKFLIRMWTLKDKLVEEHLKIWVKLWDFS